MLDTDTKRRIDTARDILVGKVPDPKSQVEQITIALIYKFMDDMDAESEELGGKRKFFAGGYARYGWAKLMRSGLGGHETLNLYAEAIAKMPENPGIPPLFRDIFKNAFLPYRDPETLRAFLKVIDEFEYDHSERLGDAFEYLLSVLGSQGEAGQFRTPRHIIDFIVEVVDPKKNETVLDPACGTAGFLISSYKHILKANADRAGNSTLTPDERGRLAVNFKGYDISPDMVRLSLVNLYLHGFTAPQIYEYDTLTSQDRWNEYADVILANPPFMSPKGGIKPHNRFGVQSKRSEVLFVDYMAEHLTPNGRAGIIVPEGIIFQSQTAYTQLRKMLVEDYLVAVVSLPAGVFNPYSGVKTSILILDKTLAKKTDSIAVFNVENDGFNLGAQRRPIDKNDLPQALAEIAEYLRRLRARKSVEDFKPTLGLIVPKEKLAANGDFNLSGERYRESSAHVAFFPRVKLSKFAEIAAGNSAPQGDAYFTEGNLSFVRTSDVGLVHLSAAFSGSADKVNQKAVSDLRLRLFPAGTILFPKSGASTFLNHRVILATPAYVSSHLACIICDGTVALPRFTYEMLINIDARQLTADQAYPSLRLGDIGNIEIPLPPLAVQKEIVTEIEGYQKVIDGARAVVDNYRPHIPIDPSWPMVELNDVCEINPETIDPDIAFPGKRIFYIDISSVENGTGRLLNYNEIASSEAPTRARRLVRSGDVLLSTVRPNLKAFALLRTVSERSIASTGFAVLRSHSDSLAPAFLLYCVFSDNAVEQMVGMMGRGAYPSINQTDVASIRIPLPPLETQRAIIAEIEAEQALVNANRVLIGIMEKKITDILMRIWGNEPIIESTE